jgi:3-phenylpropionate/trans-cinnamate dioxygenase ferredoxin subunit
MAETKNFVKVGALSDVPKGRAEVFEVNGKRYAVCHSEDGVYAIDDRCTHDNGPLGEGELLDGEIECPRHGARFDIKTGKALCFPAVGAVHTYSVEIRDGDIYLGLPVNH